MWYRRVVGVAFLVVGLGAVAVGTVGISGIFDPKSPDVKSFQVKVPPKRKLGGQVNGSPASDQYLGVPFVPLYYSIPALGLHHIRIYPEQDPHGSLVIPPIQLGVAWWEGGAKAGASTGTTLLAGHDDWVGFGNGPMQRIWYLKPGTTATLYGASRDSESRWALFRRQRHYQSVLAIISGRSSLRCLRRQHQRLDQRGG